MFEFMRPTYAFVSMMTLYTMSVFLYRNLGSRASLSNENEAFSKAQTISNQNIPYIQINPYPRKYYCPEKVAGFLY